MMVPKKVCYECRGKFGTLFPLVRSSTILPVDVCLKCKETKYPWLSKSGTVSQKDWLEGGGLTEPKKAVRKRGMPKCSEGGTHCYVPTRPNHTGTYGLRMKAMSVREAYETECESALSEARKWMPGQVFFYWRCTRCPHHRFEILSVEEVTSLIENI